MTQEVHRYEYNKTTLSDCLQNATTLIRSYLAELSAQTPKLIKQTNQLWELSQRHRLVSGVDKTAAVALISACHAAYRPIFHIIQNLHEKLAEIADRVAEFERESFALKEEVYQTGQQRFQLESIADRNAWLFQTLNVLQTQAKYLDMHARSLAPSLVQSSTVKLLKEAIHLVKQYESNFCMGFARAAT